jgi:hypothetical protein
MVKKLSDPEEKVTWMPYPYWQKPSEPHTHKNERGVMVQCYHKCKSMFSFQFIAGVTLSFPVEHFLYERVWPFTLITKWMGLH